MAIAPLLPKTLFSIYKKEDTKMSLTPSIKLNYLDQVLQSTQVFVSKPQPSEKLQNKYNICKCRLLVVLF